MMSKTVTSESTHLVTKYVCDRILHGLIQIHKNYSLIVKETNNDSLSTLGYQINTHIRITHLMNITS